MFELGNSLREARVRQGLDHAQAELATKIRAKYLRALEDEQFEVLPAETYVKGFLRAYADCLGLDGQLYVDEYSSRHASGHVDEPAPRRSSTRAGHERGLERKVVLAALAGIAALTALVIVAWKFGGTDTAASTPAVLRPAAVVKGLRFSGPGTYVEVRRGSATGPVLYQGTLQAGERDFVPGTAFWLSIEHPRGLRVTLDGKPVALPARQRLVVVVSATRTALVGG